MSKAALADCVVPGVVSIFLIASIELRRSLIVSSNAVGTAGCSIRGLRVGLQLSGAIDIPDMDILRAVTRLHVNVKRVRGRRGSAGSGECEGFSRRARADKLWTENRKVSGVVPGSAACVDVTHVSA